MKTLVNESGQTTLFLEIRKEVVPGGTLELSDADAGCKEVQNYFNQKLVSFRASTTAPAAAPAAAPVAAPKERTPTQPIVPTPEPKPEAKVEAKPEVKP